jgi:regulatory protein
VEIIQKIRQYCAYQERCHQEVKEKLAQLGVFGIEAQSYISDLIAENYLNEERFARAYVGGKFRIKQWGRKKIIYELKRKQVSEYCIKKGLLEIEDEAYFETIEKLIQTKMISLEKEKNQHIKQRKIIQSLIQKGFEYDLIQQILKEG